MRFQTKLLYTYSLLIVLLVAVISILFYSYSSGVFERNATGTYELLCTKLSQQLDNIFKPMDFISTNLISDASFKSALATLGSLDGRDPGNFYFTTEALQIIRNLLSSYSIYKNFYSVVVFNGKGDFFSSNFMNHKELSIPPSMIPTLPWIGRATEAAGRSVAVSPYDDRWRAEGRARVFGRARIVPGTNFDLGYIEVQNRYEDLEPLLAVPDKEFVRVLVLQPDGETFYQSESLSSELIGFYRSEPARAGRAVGFQPNPITREPEFISSTTSAYTGLTVTLVLNRRILLAPLGFIRSISIAIAFFIILFSMAYTWVSSRQLARPLRLIKARMEETELSNLPLDAPIVHPNDEVVALDRAFRSLTGRLDEAIRHELDSRTAWMQARMDSLQAQVNPHFINNILTVIANRGLESGDARIGDICNGVAAMLRYSTSTEERSATLADELEHARTYLFLMQQRLEDRLQYVVDAEPGVELARVPKIILQQFIENSISHGYQHSPKAMSIAVLASVAGDRWFVEITDDGEGFPPDRLEALNERLEAIALGLRSGIEETGFGLGGLGLLNTYSRLYLFYHGDLLWTLENRESGGARVLIGGPLECDDGEARCRGS